jgi:hypothetical protein
VRRRSPKIRQPQVWHGQATVISVTASPYPVNCQKPMGCRCGRDAQHDHVGGLPGLFDRFTYRVAELWKADRALSIG